MPEIIGCLAMFFGERPFTAVFYEPELEFLNLFDQMARDAFLQQKTGHTLISITDLTDMPETDATIATHRALFEPKVNQTINWVGLNNVVAYAHQPPEMEFIQEFIRADSENTDQINLERAFQVLRWIKGEDLLGDLYKIGKASELKRWLLDAETKLSSR